MPPKTKDEVIGSSVLAAARASDALKKLLTANNLPSILEGIIDEVRGGTENLQEIDRRVKLTIKSCKDMIVELQKIQAVFEKLETA